MTKEEIRKGIAGHEKRQRAIIDAIERAGGELHQDAFDEEFQRRGLASYGTFNGDAVSGDSFLLGNWTQSAPAAGRITPNQQRRERQMTPETADTTQAPAVGVPRLVRRCGCKYQAKESWGYDLCEWVGGRKSWKNHGSATHPEDIVKYASDKKLKTILVRCNGCGADALREYPANTD